MKVINVGQNRNLKALQEISSQDLSLKAITVTNFARNPLSLSYSHFNSLYHSSFTIGNVANQAIPPEGAIILYFTNLDVAATIQHCAAYISGSLTRLFCQQYVDGSEIRVIIRPYQKSISFGSRIHFSLGWLNPTTDSVNFDIRCFLQYTDDMDFYSLTEKTGNSISIYNALESMTLYDESHLRLYKFAPKMYRDDFNIFRTPLRFFFQIESSNVNDLVDPSFLFFKLQSSSMTTSSYFLDTGMDFACYIKQYRSLSLESGF